MFLRGLCFISGSRFQPWVPALPSLCDCLWYGILTQKKKKKPFPTLNWSGQYFITATWSQVGQKLIKFDEINGVRATIIELMPWKKGKETRARLAGWRYNTMAGSKPDTKYAGVFIWSGSMSGLLFTNYVVCGITFQLRATGARFAHEYWRLNPGPHARAPNVLQTEPSSQPCPFFF